VISVRHAQRAFFSLKHTAIKGKLKNVVVVRANGGEDPDL